MNLEDIRRQLPKDLRSSGYWAGEEAAWPRSEAAEVIDWLCARGLAVGGVEIWLPADEGAEIPAPVIYTWNAPERESQEEWATYVQRSCRESAAYVRQFEWDPTDRHYQGRDPLFCLDFFSEGEEADLA